MTKDALRLRVAVVSGALVALLGLALGLTLRSALQEQALQGAEQIAATLAEGVVAPLVSAADLDGPPPTDARTVELDRAITAALLETAVAGVAVLNRDGTVVYDSQTRPPGVAPKTEGDLQQALGGVITSHLAAPTRQDQDAGNSGQLQVLVPLRRARTTGAPEVIGVIEVHLPLASASETILAREREMTAILVAGLVALWLSLMHLVTTASRRLRNQLERNEFLATHDSLSGLPNRRAFEAELTRRLGASSADAGTHVTMLIDLDRFADVNDTFGHAVGDRLLREVGGRLLERSGTVGTFAQLGGDEFAVFIAHATDTNVASLHAANLLQALREPITVDGLQLDIDASIGIGHASSADATYDTLMHRAQRAMKEAKAQRGRVSVWQPSSEDQGVTRLVLFSELRRAIADEEIEVAYQPKVDVASGRVCGVEALARWTHAEHGTVYPDVFIPLAEQTGLAPGLTRVMLRKSMHATALWRLEHPALTLAVNLSTRDLLDRDLPDVITRLLVETGLPARALELEVTETAAMQDPERSMEVLQSLRDIGVSLAVDDYGTGYSSLAYLQSLPLDTLKIDRSFVMHLGAAKANEAIISSTVSLAASLGLDVVAEGVEDADAFAFLRTVGCKSAQGYWLARPAPAAQMLAVIADLEARLATPVAAPAS